MGFMIVIILVIIAGALLLVAIGLLIVLGIHMKMSVTKLKHVAHRVFCVVESNVRKMTNVNGVLTIMVMMIVKLRNTRDIIGFWS